MKISTKGRYALRVMLDLAENAGERYISLAEISSRQEITVKYLEQIISLLSKADFVESQRGSAGGYRLKRPSDRYSVGEILRASEGSLCLVSCSENGECSRYAECRAVEFWKGLDKVIADYIDGITLEDILKKERASAKKDPSIWIL